MKNFRNFVSAALALTLTLSLAACGSQETTSDDSGDGSSPKYLIGISQYGQHGSLDNCREGFLQGLEEAGLKEGVDFEVDYRNADFDDTMTTQIGDAFRRGQGHSRDLHRHHRSRGRPPGLRQHHRHL